jgi:biotin synthase
MRTLDTKISDLAHAVLEGQPIDRDDALYLIQLPPEQRYELFYWANQIRIQCCGPEISLCAIASARTARCPEDCRFCAQSAHYQTETQPHTATNEELLTAAAEAQKLGAHSFGIVTSGRSVTDQDIDRLEPVFRQLAESDGPNCCASLGCLTLEQAQRLCTLGVRRYNHNLETSRRFFSQIVSTHTYDDRLATIKNAQQADLEICCGGILGMGETFEDRIDLALTLRDLDVDIIPLNFLIPITGTPLKDLPPIPPMTLLHTIAVFRLILRNKSIKIAGGREAALRELQSWLFFAGATSIMIGNYLTTTGRTPEEDFQMLTDLELPWNHISG